MLFVRYQPLALGGGGGGGVTTVGLIDSQTPSSNGAVIVGSSLFMQSASLTVPGLVNNAAQSFSGNKTFSGTVTANIVRTHEIEDFSSILSIDVDNRQLTDTAGNPELTWSVAGLNVPSLTASQLVATDAAKNLVSQATGNLTDAGTDGIAVTNGTGAVVGTGTSIAQHVADATHNGYLSSTDWSTFNAKQPAGNYITALTGDVTASGPGSSAATLATVNSNVGSFTNASITVNGKGLITAASNGATAVTSLSVATANGFAGSFTASTTPILTLTTTVTGVLSGNGTSISAASTTGSGSVVLATAPTMTNPIVGTQSQGDTSTKAASTAYVDVAIANAVAGVNPAVAVQAATTAASDTSGFTYNNGASGIGATLTGPVNTPLTIDGYTFTALGQRLLVKNDTQSPSGAFNGVYYVTQVQTAILPLILTRALDYDMPSDMNNTGAIPVINGTVNGTTQWVLTSLVVTVGTSPLTFTKFSSNPATLGTVTSVDMTVPAFLSVSGNPITTSGTLALTLSGTALPIANGGTAVTSVTTAPTATAFAGWDANKNLSANSLVEGYTTTATAAGTTTLVVGSTYQQYFTGVTTQTCQLPVTSTLVLGQQFLIVNLSTGLVTINSSGSNLVQTLQANSSATVTVILTSGTTAASWSVVYNQIPTGAAMAPTVQTFTSGTAQTYTAHTNPAPLYIRVRMSAGGGGGGGSGSGAGTGGTGGTSSFGTTLLSCTGGVGGSGGSSDCAGGSGGTASLGSGPIGTAITGGGGGSGMIDSSSSYGGGGIGGSGPLGGAGKGAIVSGAVGNAGVANTGGGGSGATFGNAAGGTGGGGGAGGYLDAIIASPSATYIYSVGAGGIAGTAGTGNAGGAGGTGYIEVTEYYAGNSTGGTPVSNQTANTVYAGPSSGGAAAPGFRALVPADLPGPYLWSGYHANDSSWARTNSSFGDPTADATSTFTETLNQNFGSVTSAQSAGNNLPGIVFTPPAVGGYWIKASFKVQGSNVDGVSLDYQLIDTAGSPFIVDQIQFQTIGTTQDIMPGYLQGNYYCSDTTSRTIKIQLRSGSGTNTITTAGTSNRGTVEWSIHRI